MLALSTILTTGLVGLAVLDSVNAASTGQRAINAKKIKTSVFAPGNYSVVDGVFIQSSGDFNATAFDVFNATESFGLVDKSSGRWQNLTEYVAKLNAEADENTAYKVIYIARHGQGYHNAAETAYGKALWDCWYSLLTGDGNSSWADAELTPLGIEQAQENNAAWKTQIEEGVPLPQKLYSSPMRRAAKTLDITWSDILLNQDGYRPLIREGLRESIGLHTCDERSNKTVIEGLFPGFDFEPSFTHNDELWTPDFQETSAQQTVRMQQVFNNLFATDDSAFIYIACHSGVISSSFRALNHPVFSVQTGGMVPMLIKAEGGPNVSRAVITGGNSNVGAPLCTAPVTVSGGTSVSLSSPIIYPVTTTTVTPSPSASGSSASEALSTVVVTVTATPSASASA